MGVGVVWPSSAMARRMDPPRAKSENWFKGYFQIEARRTSAPSAVFCRSGVMRRPARIGLSGFSERMKTSGRVPLEGHFHAALSRARWTALPLDRRVDGAQTPECQGKTQVHSPKRLGYLSSRRKRDSLRCRSPSARTPSSQMCHKRPREAAVPAGGGCRLALS
jgi:hypothetical protein